MRMRAAGNKRMSHAILEGAGIPQSTQTAYRRNVACSDSIFAGQESISKFTNEGDCIYSCFYDLASAQLSLVFYYIEQLSHAGIKRKCWRLIRNWYKNLSSQVHLGSCLSKPFPIERGVRQGSVLSPILFNLVMDPLLVDLKSRNHPIWGSAMNFHFHFHITWLIRKSATSQ